MRGIATIVLCMTLATTAIAQAQTPPPLQTRPQAQQRPQAQPQAQPRDDYTSVGAGVSTCAEVTAYVNDHPDKAIMFFSWAQGFMSGLNVQKSLTRQKSRDLGALTTSDQQERLKSVCEENPTASYGSIVLAFYNSLPELAPAPLPPRGPALPPRNPAAPPSRNPAAGPPPSH
jgi:hypothetical protein